MADHGGIRCVCVCVCVCVWGGGGGGGGGLLCFCRKTFKNKISKYRFKRSISDVDLGLF